MSNATIVSNDKKQLWIARARRFFRWLTTPHVVLSIIMLAVMIYMVIIHPATPL